MKILLWFSCLLSEFRHDYGKQLSFLLTGSSSEGSSSYHCYVELFRLNLHRRFSKTWFLSLTWRSWVYWSLQYFCHFWNSDLFLFRAVHEWNLKWFWFSDFSCFWHFKVRATAWYKDKAVKLHIQNYFMLVKPWLFKDYRVLPQKSNEHRSSQFWVILNCQTRIDGMGDWLLCQVSIKALDWFWFWQWDGVNFKVFTHDMRCCFINKSIFSCISVYKSLDTVSLVVTEQGTRDNQRFWSKRIICHAWRRWNQQRAFYCNFDRGYTFFDPSTSSSWIHMEPGVWVFQLFEQVTDMCFTCLQIKHFPWAHNCSHSATVVLVTTHR